MTHRSFTRLALLSATALAGISAAGFAGTAAMAQDLPAAEADAGDVIIVTGTRRSLSLQDAPINIAALGAEQLNDQRLNDVRDLGAFTPGITITDTGPRGAGSIVMRGLSASDTSTFADNTNNAIGTYLGEVPLYLDFKLIDLQRVEVLLGPQGTLYGLGTLAGAIRYIPERPDASKVSGYAHARLYDVKEGSGFGFVLDGAINLPIIPDVLAFRSATGYYYDPGFIDYPFTVAQIGVSDPQPGPSSTNPLGTTAQQQANFAPQADVNYEKTLTTRNQLGLTVGEVKAYLSYVFQETKTGGRQANGGGVLGEGKYQGVWRVQEPSRRRSELVSLEVEAQLGDFAQLVSATAYTETKNRFSQDVTDLLLDLDYGYEAFPAFTGFTRSRADNEQFNQELRLVSTHGGPFSWVIGGFYNKLKTATSYREYIPGFAASPTGQSFGVIPNADDNEYASFGRSTTKEKAIYGELSFKITPEWQVTGGARYYDYKLDRFGGSTLPYYDGPVADDLDIPSSSGAAEADGFVWKANTSYQFTPDLLAYFTYSTGYRIGGANTGAAPCVLPLNPNVQNICALPDELFFGPDETTNYELGIRAGLFGNRLTTNLSIFQVDWDGIQLDGQTINGGIGITSNGGKARNRGVDFSFNANLTDRLSLRGNYSYLDAKLTEDVPDLLQIRNSLNERSRPKFSRVDVFSGDRLPGSAKNSGALSATYSLPTGSNETIFNWTATYTGGILTRVGARGFGERLPSYVMHRASVTYRTPVLEMALFANNIFNKYAVTGVSNDLSRFGFVNGGVISRYYGRSVARPRVIGVEARVKF
ncbi:TonB-dependent receptor [Sphingobium algorifonticola]|uniref:TonB-dependent receptor n=1 Tax=Sphingobium algorifonticola TaxID=2008318 RepID=A0A437J6C9_9SPHN|nr:TonB-dependent receptor [Sphingobium algorifonticola]RVT40728.1 TonB-dependent receptor [Sphingobium algorifonticola]